MTPAAPARRLWSALALVVSLACLAACEGGGGSKAKPTATPCEVDGECDPGRCDPLHGCVDCLFDSDCSEGERCAGRVCEAIEACSQNRDCEAGRCDTQAGYCAECSADRDCDEGEVCSNGACEVPTPCNVNDDCPAVYYCDDDRCLLDICEPGRASCAENGTAREICTKVGDAFDLEPCGEAEACAVDEEGEAQCLPSEPRCEGDDCQPSLCEPGARRCEGDSLAVCGATREETLEPCLPDERCDPELAECVARVCEPQSPGCLAETIATCDDEGRGFEPTGEDCAEGGQACWEGICQPIVCEGEGPRCIDGDSFSCSANRTQLTLAEACDFGSRLFCNQESGLCQEFACEPGQPTCEGDFATSCADDGSHALDFGIDCAATQKVCWAAECLSPICEQDSYSCDDATLLRCVHKGTGLEPDQECLAGTVCDAAAGTCRLQKCEPDQPACDGDVATTCDGTGLGYVGERDDCALDDDVCVGGACVPVICEPEATYCQEDELRLCGPNGGAFELLDTCLPSEYCRPDRVACSPDECAAGTPVCSGNVLTTCLPDGSGPAPAGTDCGDRVCDRGACRERICEPDTQLCEGNAVLKCNSAGTVAAPFQSCRALEHCAEAQLTATCAPDICPQGGVGCQGERVSSCNATGSGFTSQGTDCSATNQVCDLTGACLAVAVDQLGSPASARHYPGSAIHYGALSVATPRTLVEIEAALTPTVEPVTWVVYRSVNQHGTYTLVDQFGGPATVLNGYVSSGAIEVPLASGFYYLFGIVVSDAHDIATLEGSSPAPMSMGVALGGLSYVAGAIPTIHSELQLSAGDFGDDVLLRMRTAEP